jgi:hypothetical protein
VRGCGNVCEVLCGIVLHIPCVVIMFTYGLSIFCCFLFIFHVCCVVVLLLFLKIYVSRLCMSAQLIIVQTSLILALRIWHQAISRCDIKNKLQFVYAKQYIIQYNIHNVYLFIEASMIYYTTQQQP